MNDDELLELDHTDEKIIEKYMRQDYNNNSTSETDEEVINEYIRQDSGFNRINVIVSDDAEYIINNNKAFSKLLNIYVNNANKNLAIKLCFKNIFFHACVIILIGIFVLLWKTTWYCLQNEVATNTLIITMINMIVSFISSFIVLPRIIAQYLYNSNEEKDLTELIKNIQERDKIIRESMNKKIGQ